MCNGTIYLFEVKNYQGDCYFQDDQFFYPHHFEIKNPLHQASDNAIALKQLLRGKHFQIKHWVVFTNPDFTLKQVKRTDPIILPNQIERHLEYLRHSSSPSTKADYELAMHLLQLDNPSAQLKYLDIPLYDFSHLKKGLKCRKCHVLSVEVSGRTCSCQKCSYREPVYQVVQDEYGIENVPLVHCFLPLSAKKCTSKC
ncbi:nuclease-related domain-containing protein, partial [Jeotgalibaca sp. YN-L-12]